MRETRQVTRLTGSTRHSTESVISARARPGRAWKRLFDLVGAAILLALLAPLIAVVAAVIKLDSPGPVFFGCERIGFRGRAFRMLKFRKMRDGAQGPALTSAEDVRFTRVGRCLARSKLDELPQLVNVLKGDMSFVGPRPEDPSFVQLRPADFAEILRVKPGITGLAQLAFAKEAEILDEADRVGDYVERILPQKLSLDRLYARCSTPLMDLNILIWTAVAVLARCDVAVNRESGRLGWRRRLIAPSLAPEILAPEGVQE